ncbi:MAG: transpeptidase family protein [Bacteroidaceae bacterium]|nr:transpeptidase family protein [Bacteroidaceae bacterium]
MGVVGIIILLKAMSVMVFERNYWKEVASRSIVDSVAIAPRRGNILSDDGLLMASSVPQYTLFMDFMVSDRDEARRIKAQNKRDSLLRVHETEICEGLHRILPDKSVEEFRQTFRKGRERKSRYWKIYPKRVSYAQYKEIKELPVLSLRSSVGGFFTESNIRREKIYGSLAQRTLGDVYAKVDSAKNGVELAYDDYLRGTPGLGHKKKVNNEHLTIIDEPAIDGMDVQTTLNVEIQDIAEKALLDVLHKQNEVYGGDARTGVVIVMEVATGDIKAIVNMNRLDDGSYYETKNNALTDILEPGSTFKTASLLVALDDKKISINDSVDANRGLYKFGSATMRDHNWNKASAYGVLSVPQVLMYSSNVGTARLIDENYGKEPEKFVEGLHRMGLATHFPLLPGTGRPVIRKPNKDKSNWSRTALPWMSIGYETQIAPINIVSFYNAIANDGKFMKPRLVKAILEDGHVVEEFKPEVLIDKIASKQALDDITKMLTMVVNEPTGLGRQAGSEEFLVAGKTGTAQIASGGQLKGGGHQLSFCGFFPADAPKYTCIVSIQTRGGLISGGGVAGVVFGDIAKRVMARDARRDISELVDSTAIYTPEVLRGNIADARYVLDALDIRHEWDASQTYRKGKTVWGKAESIDNQVQLTEVAFTPTEGKVPNVKGLGAKDAVYMLEACGLRVQLSGIGKVYTQSIPHGSAVKKGQTIYLKLK